MSVKWTYIWILLIGWIFFDGMAFERGAPIDPDGERLLIVDHGLHVGLVFNRSALASSTGEITSALLLQFPDADWFEFGWGDKGFYQGAASLSDVSIPMAARALLLPTNSVMHVATGQGDAADVFAAVDPVELHLAEIAIGQMVAEIETSFASMVPTGSGLYAISRFYSGNGKYYLLRTCNNWASQVLRHGGIGASPILASFSRPLVLELRWKYGV